MNASYQPSAPAAAHLILFIALSMPLQTPFVVAFSKYRLDTHEAK